MEQEEKAEHTEVAEVAVELVIPQLAEQKGVDLMAQEEKVEAIGPQE